MNTEEMSNYLGVDRTLNASDPVKRSIAAALAEQVHTNFDYKITSSEESGYTASIETQITTFDSDAILEAYKEDLDTYLASPDAVIDGSQKRYQKSYELLLKYIQENTAVKTTSATFSLVNDGVSWKLEDSSHSLGNAIFGTLSTSPVEETEE